MYINKCSKCGKEFETKNPKRVICPECLYPDRNPLLQQNNSQNEDNQQPKQEQEQRASYSFGGDDNAQQRSYSNYNRDSGYNRDGGNRNYNRDGGNRNYNRDGGYNRGGGYNRDGGNRNYNRDGGNRNYNRDGGYNRGGGYNRDGGYNRNNNGGNRNNFRRPQGGRPQGGFNKRPAKKALLVSKEQVAMIEVLYKRMLPLPNPDAHEVIGAEIGLEANKVFFGINLVRQKLHLPKLPFPKRKLAISPEQLMAIKSLYEPMLPLPPIGCHKIIAAQLKMDEWRVHVGIGLVRKQMGMERWNQEREDAPEEYKNQAKNSEEKAE